MPLILTVSPSTPYLPRNLIFSLSLSGHHIPIATSDSSKFAQKPSLPSIISPTNSPSTITTFPSNKSGLLTRAEIL